MEQRKQYLLSLVLVSVLSALQPVPALAQGPVNLSMAKNLPAAPVPQVPGQNSSGAPMGTQTAQSQASAGPELVLTLKQAEALAIQNNPQISAARLIVLASQQVTREARAGLFPVATGNITGVDAESGTRISAGALNNPVIYERAAAGL